MRTKDFENIHEEGGICIGYIVGDSNAVFIKTGQGGSIYGYEDKYLDLALHLNGKYGCSVFVSKTSVDGRCNFGGEMELVKKILGENAQIYYVGVSKGGLIGCWNALQFGCIKRILAINAPLMINFHNKTLPAVKSYERGKISMVYGSLDPSYTYIPFISGYVDVQTVDGADHNFSEHLDVFKRIIEDGCGDFIKSVRDQ